VAARPPVVLPALFLVTALAVGCQSIAPSALPDPFERELGRLLLVGFDGSVGPGNAVLEELLCRLKVGGVVLFSRNIVNAEQLTRLTAWTHQRAIECTGRPVLIAVDAEGGAVMRLSPDAGYTETLSHRELGDANDLALTELEARRIGGMLRVAGIDWNLAPVVDVATNPANPVIVGAGRSFGANPHRVTAHARAYLIGMRAAGVLTTLKHFPGHGSSTMDSHLGFVDVTETANLDVELEPYRALIAEQLVDTVMTAHVFNRHLDPRYPATLSAATIAELLRRDLGFAGLVVTDDLRMGAIEQHYGTGPAAVRALAAGADMVLIANDDLLDGQSAAPSALAAIRRALRRGRLEPARVQSALERVRALKTRPPKILD